ncbi:MAG: TldD/PmbA family protein [Candidatus Njordarchaeia archaeon]
MENVKEIAEEVLDKAMKIADDAAILVTRRVSHQTRFSQNKIDVVKTWYETTIDLMIDKDKKTTVTSLSLPALENIDKILEMIKIALEKSSPKPFYAELPEPSKNFPTTPNKVDREVVEKPEKMIDITKTAIEQALSSGAKRVAGSMKAHRITLALATSKGASLTDEYTNTNLDVRAFIDGLETGHASQIGRGFKNINPEKLATEAAEVAKLSVNPRNAEPGRYPTLITPNAVAALFNNVAGSASAFAVLMGFSFFVEKLGKQVAKEDFTLIDNPNLETSASPRSFDNEAIATRENVIIENGVLKTLLHNRFTAKIFQAELTGNAGWISPEPWHIYIEPGEISREEMLEDLREGYILNNVTYIRFQNYVTGDFSGIIRDGLLYVKDGEVKYAIKGLRFSDNMLRLMQNIRYIGKDVENIFHWWLEHGVPVTTPSLLVEGCGYTKAHG